MSIYQYVAPFLSDRADTLTTMNGSQTENALPEPYGDPVGFLAAFGIEATLIAEITDEIPRAA